MATWERGRFYVFRAGLEKRWNSLITTLGGGDGGVKQTPLRLFFTAAICVSQYGSGQKLCGPGQPAFLSVHESVANVLPLASHLVLMQTSHMPVWRH